MPKWFKIALTLLFTLTIFGTLGCSNKKYEEAKNLADQGNALRTDLTNNRPNAEWTDAQMSDYQRKIDDYSNTIDRANANGGVYGTEDAGKFIAWAKGELQTARRLKAAFGPGNNSDNPEIVRFNRLDSENERISKSRPKAQTNGKLEDMPVSQLKKWITGSDEISKNLQAQYDIASRNALITKDQKLAIAIKIYAETLMREEVKAIIQKKTGKKSKAS